MPFTFNPFTATLDAVRSIVIAVASSAPAVGPEGSMYFNTTDSTIYVSVSGFWVAANGGGSGGMAGQPMGLLLALTYAS